jgi:hypothetical protein
MHRSNLSDQTLPADSMEIEHELMRDGMAGSVGPARNLTKYSLTWLYREDDGHKRIIWHCTPAPSPQHLYFTSNTQARTDLDTILKHYDTRTSTLLLFVTRTHTVGLNSTHTVPHTTHSHTHSTLALATRPHVSGRTNRIKLMTTFCMQAFDDHVLHAGFRGDHH